MASASPDARFSFRQRPREIEDPLNRFIYHPLAAQLARWLQPTGLSPNAVSVAGMLLVWSAAWSYAALPWPQGASLGFLLLLLWHVVDGADGDLARLTGKASATGELVDGVCDYAGHTLLYFVLAALLDDGLGLWAWLLAVAAGASHVAQTNHTESQRRVYLWWAYGIPWLKHAHAAGDQVFRQETWFSILFSWMARLYLKLASRMSPLTGRIDAEIEAAAADPERIDRIREIVRHASRTSLLYQKALAANPRTIILGVSMLLGSPIYFFLTEAVLQNVLLAVSVRHHNRVARRLVEQLQEDRPAAG